MQQWIFFNSGQIIFDLMWFDNRTLYHMYKPNNNKC